MLTTTIAAISTPVAPGGIGIVRLSGPRSVEIAERLFTPRGKTPLREKKTHTLTLGTVRDPDSGVAFDEALASVMRAPNSYTGEDVVELNCHGGVGVCTKVLELCLHAGADLAQPGEFSKRAFLNGKMDLTQAEAVIDLISAGYDTAMKTAAAQVEGKMGREISEIRGELIYLNATILSLIEYPEETDLEETPEDFLFNTLGKQKDRINKLYTSYRLGKVIKEGIDTVIAGRPNVGKSSLLNALSGFDRAIVTDIAGTTRDVLTEQINIGSVILNISDTAGVRESLDPIEKAGVDRSLKLLDRATLVLFVVDSSAPLSTEDQELVDKMAGRTVILVLNKTDLPAKADEAYLTARFPHVVRLSAKTGENMDRLRDEINALFVGNQAELQGGAIVTNLRQRDCLKRAMDSLQKAMDGLIAGFTNDLCTIDIEDAIGALGELTGENASEDTINNIFSRFCLGK